VTKIKRKRCPFLHQIYGALIHNGIFSYTATLPHWH